MSEFKPITTQEEFDAAISDRLKREREKYADYDNLKSNNSEQAKKIGDLEKSLNDANEKISGHQKTVDELNAKIKGYETDSAKTRIALAAGLPYEMASRLKGDSEDDIKKDAESLAKMMGVQSHHADRSRNNDTGNGKKAGDEMSEKYGKLLNNLMNKGD